MTHAEQLCDHVVMIHRGDKVLDQTMAGIRETFDPHRILFEPLDPASDMRGCARVPGVSDVVRDGTAWEVVLDGERHAGDVIPALVAAVVPSRVEVSRPTLEDVFVSIVSGRRVERDRRRRAAAGGAAGRRAGGAAMKKMLLRRGARVHGDGHHQGIRVRHPASRRLLIAGLIFLIPKVHDEDAAEGRGRGGRHRSDRARRPRSWPPTSRPSGSPSAARRRSGTSRRRRPRRCGRRRRLAGRRRRR